ncbi:MAG: hypothetical protein R2867_12705 [Caldilineaceae bacterium]
MKALPSGKMGARDWLLLIVLSIHIPVSALLLGTLSLGEEFDTRDLVGMF